MGAEGADAAVVEAMLRAVAAGDSETALAGLDPEATIDWSNSLAPYAGVYRGHDEIRRSFEENLFTTFERVDVEIERFADLGDGTVVVGSHVKATGREGIEVDAHGGQLWRFRGGKIVFGKLFQDFETALAEAGAESAE